MRSRGEKSGSSSVFSGGLGAELQKIFEIDFVQLRFLAYFCAHLNAIQYIIDVKSLISYDCMTPLW